MLNSPLLWYGLKLLILTAVLYLLFDLALPLLGLSPLLAMISLFLALLISGVRTLRKLGQGGGGGDG